MKRVIVLLLVLGLASTASAVVGMKVYVEGVLAGDFAPVAVGDTVKVAIYDTAPTVSAIGVAGFADFKIHVSGGIYNVGSEVWADGPFSGSPFFVGPWAASPLPPSLIGIVDGLGGFDAKIDALFGASPFAPPFPGDMVSFTFTATGVPITIDPYYGQYNGDGVSHPAIVGSGDDYGTVTLIPEPMTIALLGLGGLFLRKRR